MKANFAVGLMALGLISGCVSGQSKREEPDQYNVINTRTYKLSKEKLWAKLIPAIGSSFFTINTLEKSSGLLSLSFSADPEKYVDCGTLNSEVSNARGKRSYFFPLSRASMNYEVNDNGTLRQMRRTLGLEGKINLIVQEIDKNTSSMTANVRYVLTKHVLVAVMDNNYRMVDVPHHETLGFDSKTGGSFEGPQGTKCAANGKLEQELLNLVSEK